jgi:hypothetical protein
VTLGTTASDPDGPGYFTTFRWDTDADGQFDDATGAKLTRTFPTAGQQVIGVEASKPGGDVTSFYGVFDVAAAPAPPPPPPPAVTPPATTPAPPAVGPKGTLTVARSLRARKGRFAVKLTFGPSTPTGTATLVVLNGRKKLATVKVPVRPGKTARATVKLTKAGQRLLKQRGKLKVKLRLTVNHAVSTRSLTLRR